MLECLPPLMLECLPPLRGLAASMAASVELCLQPARSAPVLQRLPALRAALLPPRSASVSVSASVFASASASVSASASA
jgi:hypothetical protein